MTAMDEVVPSWAGRPGLARHDVFRYLIQHRTRSASRMWIFTQHGYLSIVQHFDPKPRAELLVRARCRRHLATCLQQVVSMAEADAMIQHTPEGDYPWRTVTSRELVQRLAAGAVEALDYPNFKGRCASTWGPDSDVLHDVWSATRELTPASEQGGC